MDLKGRRTITADRMRVWDALNDPEVLKICIPGCSELSGNATEGFEAVVNLKIGPMQATFNGQIDLSDVIKGKSYKISGQGKGGPAGYAKGDAVVSLVDENGGTLLTYKVNAKVGGKLASLGTRLIDGVAKKLADRFFETFQATVEGPPAEVASAAPEEIKIDSIFGNLLNWFKGIFGK